MRKEVKASYNRQSFHLQERRRRKLDKLYSPHSRTKQIEYQRSKRSKRRFRKKSSPSGGVDDREVPSTVINLSGVHLSEDEVKLLSKGLSFCPTPRRADKDEILDDLESYFRRLRLKEFFLDNEEHSDDDDAQPRFRPLSTWMPPKGGDAALETYIRKFRADVKQQLEVNQLKRCTDNLTSAERIALRGLRQRTDVVIKPADKGSAVVVLSKEDYIDEAERQLNNRAHYAPLNADPTPRSASQELYILYVCEWADRQTH